MDTKRRKGLKVVVASLMLMVFAYGIASAAGMSGAIFTSDVSCSGTNVNIFADKDDVYLDGGPIHPGAAGLPDGSYYVKVTEPDGTLLGTSIGSGNDTPAVVSGGEFLACYHLSTILIRASNNSPGYDTTTNGGGVYKVWVSQSSGFPNNASKTDNFKVDATNPEPEQGTIEVNKFYDANANGVNDDNQPISGWKVRIQDGIDYIRYTPVSIILAADNYTITEFMPLETNWLPTTINPVFVTLDDGETETVEFGNVCLGAGGGRTLGFWSNKNGQALVGSGDITMLQNLNLRNANGTHFNPGNYAALRTWLLNANATNMAYMLSAQLAAMQLNVAEVFVDGTALIYAPGTDSANTLGFATVNDVMEEANAELGANGLVLAGHSARPLQEALKNALDRANNNLNFVQSSPCPFSFDE